MAKQEQEVYSDEEQEQLLDSAEMAINNQLIHGSAWLPDVSNYPKRLGQERATFVTLEHKDNLRGCIGVLEAYRPLVVDVAANAHAAAFSDPRFAPLQANEREALSLHISILTPPEAIIFSSKEELLAQITPGTDGLLLTAPGHRGTFLPSVWEQLPTATRFLEHLVQKAGLPATYWSDDIRIERYFTIAFGRKFRNCQ